MPSCLVSVHAKECQERPGAIGSCASFRELLPRHPQLTCSGLWMSDRQASCIYAEGQKSARAAEPRSSRWWPEWLRRTGVEVEVDGDAAGASLLRDLPGDLFLEVQLAQGRLVHDDSPEGGVVAVAEDPVEEVADASEPGGVHPGGVPVPGVAARAG